MKSLFGFQETFEVVINGVPELVAHATEAQRMSHKYAKKKDCKDSFCIQSTIDGVNFNRNCHVELAKEAWDILIKYYDGGEKVKSIKQQALRHKYELLHMGEDEKVAGYVFKVNNLAQ